MTLNDLKRLLREYGIWRAKVVQSQALIKINAFELHVPKTSLTKVSRFIWLHIPATYRVEVRELDKPLKLKKYTYLAEFVE